MGETITIIIDTGTWLKLDFLSSKKLFSPERLYSLSNVVTTHQVEEEITHYKCESYNKKKTSLLPVGDEGIYKEALSLDFDDADASIASIGKRKSKSTIIVTEDRPLLDYLELNEITAIQLAELLQIYTRLGEIEGQEFYRLTKKLQQLRNITKRKMRDLLNWKAEWFK
ncbi:MAG: hypothetical protein ACFFCS_05255 [Candidatus Hodarchaeota archaeon]